MNSEQLLVHEQLWKEHLLKRARVQKNMKNMFIFFKK